VSSRNSQNEVHDTGLDDVRVDGIAVVGMSLRFPGADSVGEYWQNLISGTESIRVFTDAELRDAGVPESRLSDPAYVKARGLISNPEAFDAAFFGYSVRDAELMDPQHRVFLETCWNALESSGYAPSRVQGNIGVWAGMSTGMENNTYLLSNLHGNPAANAPEDVLPMMLGNENDYLTTRVSYKLDLRGPSVNVQTACSTSLVAITQAYQALLTYGCDMALAGGVSISYPQKDGYDYQEGGIGSPDGHCRPFDADAAGTVFSNGVGVVVLKRLADALADGDTIWAVVRGAAMNNDGGAKMSFAAPSVDGQANVIATAQALADVSPDSITYVECHGTATPIGDPIEVTALTRAFRMGTARKGFCALGSVKSNFGHCDSAAGVAGFIKTVLALRHRQLPPTLHFRRPNPELDLENSPFFVSDSLRAWDGSAGPRRAGVSAFGIGGTNAHVILEEAPAQAAVDAADAGHQILLLSTKTQPAHDDAVSRLADHLAQAPETHLSDVAFTLQEGRERFRFRQAVVADSVADAVSVLRGGDRKRVIKGRALASGGRVAMMYSGGGTQYVGMGADLYRENPVVREWIDRGLAAYRRRTGIDLGAIWFASGDGVEAARQAFERPSLQLPAIFILQVALTRLWAHWGVVPDALIGHSMGENTAACVAGVMSFEDALGLVTLRGQLFEQVPAGGMLSVACSADQAQRYLSAQIDLATINSPAQCTLSGDREALAALSRQLEADEIEHQVIPIAIAAHSHLLEPILEPFREYLAGITLKAPAIPIVSNLTGAILTDAEARDPEYWTRHLRNTVRFADGIALLAQTEDRIFLEAGPGKVLASLARLQAQTPAERILSSTRHPEEHWNDDSYIRHSAARLWTQGQELEWHAVRGTTPSHVVRRRVPLPTYPFQHKRFFIAPADSRAADATVAPTPAATIVPAASTGHPSLMPLSGDPISNGLQQVIALQIQNNAALLAAVQAGLSRTAVGTPVAPAALPAATPAAAPAAAPAAEPSASTRPEFQPAESTPTEAPRWLQGESTEDATSAQTLVSLFESAVDAHGDATALVFKDQTVSYRELDERANQLAHWLRVEGVRPDDAVALLFERSLHMVFAMYGVMKAGGAYLPLDPDNPDARLREILSTARPRLVLCAHADLLRISPLLPAGVEARAVDALDAGWHSHGTARPKAVAGPQNLAYIIYTSGSTGTPKGVMNEHRGICSRLRWAQRQFQLTPSDVILQKTPYTFDVSVWEFFWPLEVGSRLVIAAPGGHREPKYLRQLIAEQGVTVLHFVPSMLSAFLAEPDLDQLTSVRTVICSGEALSANHRDRFFAAFANARLFNLYGPTEAAVDVTWWECQRDDVSTTVPIGFPVANTRLFVLDEAGQPVPRGDHGELYIGGTQVARGYLHNPALTAERFVTLSLDNSPERAYRTGDLVLERPDGALEFLGRVDSQVKLRGFRIELGEIEAKLMAIDSVHGCAVMVAHHGADDDRLVAFVQPAAGAGFSQLKLRRELAAKLPDYMIPQAFTEVKELPLGASGKVDRKALSALLQDSVPASAFVAPQTETEQRIAAIWSRALNLEEVSADAYFFDIGGHSLMAMSVSREMEAAFGRRFDLREMLMSNLSQLAVLVDAGGNRLLRRSVE